MSESQLGTHDVSLPLGASIDQNTGNSITTRQLRLLLLSPSSVADAKLNDTVKRIRHFASLTGGQDLAIVFLLSTPKAPAFITAKQLGNGDANQSDNVEGVYAYTKLQAELLNHGDIPHVPVLPLANLEGLPSLLEQHASALTRPPSKQSAVAKPFELLQLCTANPPMSQQTAYILSDLFCSIRELAEACTSAGSAPQSSSPSARAAGLSSQIINGTYEPSQSTSTQSCDAASAKLKRLRDLIGDRECQDIVDFWAEEWTID